MGRFFEYSYPLSELYDAWHPDRAALPKLWGDDRELYTEFAGEFGQPVLELGIGTGRVARFLAGKGFHVVGLDLSQAMIERARANMGELSVGVRERITIVEGDMRSFDLSATFPLAICPFTAFQHLLTVEDQVSALRCIREHLALGGHLLLDLFDPKLELCAPSASVIRDRIQSCIPRPAVLGSSSRNAGGTCRRSKSSTLIGASSSSTRTGRY